MPFTKGHKVNLGKRWKVSSAAVEKLRQRALGKVTSAETKRKISESMRGHAVTEETRRKIGDATKGDKHYNWRGDKAGFDSVHAWLNRHYGRANRCENRTRNILPFVCTRKSNNYDWAFKHKKGFVRDEKQYYQLCRSCHVKYDKN